MARQIKTIDELKILAGVDGGEDFFIAFNAGIRSSKHISWDEQNGKFWVLNEIDDSEQMLSPEEILDADMTNIGKAIGQGAFYSYAS